MPNRPSTPHRTMRIPADEWDAVKRQAETEGVTATDVVRRAIRAYLRLAAVVVAVALVAGCGTQAYTSEPIPTVTVTAEPATVEQHATGAAMSCLYAARIAAPAWKGVKLDLDARHRIGDEFFRLMDACLADPAGSAPPVCLDAARTLQSSKDTSTPISKIDAQYLRQWKACVSA